MSIFLFFVRLQSNSDCVKKILWKSQTQIFTKVLPAEVAQIHGDGHT